MVGRPADRECTFTGKSYFLASPSNISISCEYIAKVKKMEPTEVRQITTANAIKLFPKLARFVAR
jgi:Tat protein secretion system quality control protein TatD with DNase activity